MDEALSRGAQLMSSPPLPHDAPIAVTLALLYHVLPMMSPSLSPPNMSPTRSGTNSPYAPPSDVATLDDEEERPNPSMKVKAEAPISRNNSSSNLSLLQLPLSPPPGIKAKPATPSASSSVAKVEDLINKANLLLGNILPSETVGTPSIAKKNTQNNNDWDNTPPYHDREEVLALSLLNMVALLVVALLVHFVHTDFHLLLYLIMTKKSDN